MPFHLPKVKFVIVVFISFIIRPMPGESEEKGNLI